MFSIAFLGGGERSAPWRPRAASAPPAPGGFGGRLAAGSASATDGRRALTAQWPSEPEHKRGDRRDGEPESSALRRLPAGGSGGISRTLCRPLSGCRGGRSAIRLPQSGLRLVVHDVVVLGPFGRAGLSSTARAWRRSAPASIALQELRLRRHGIGLRLASLLVISVGQQR